MRTFDVALLVLVIVNGRSAYQAWKRGERGKMVDPVLCAVGLLALLLPDAWPVARYGIAGTAIGLMLLRAIKRDLIVGSDSVARWMTIGLLVFVASILPAMLMERPSPAWAKYVGMAGVGVLALTVLRPVWWMTRLLFSAHRLKRDLEHKRPPRAADEQVLGIDLSPLRDAYRASPDSIDPRPRG